MKFKPTTNPGGMVLELGPEEHQMPGTETSKVLKLKQILAPVDFSECSRKAIHYGSALAKQFGAKLTLLNVVQPFTQVPDMVIVDVEMLKKQMRESSEKQLAAMQNTVDSQVLSQAVVRCGDPVGEIIDVAQSGDMDLIVIGTHGRSGLKHMLMGSVAERVVRHANCPVLVVREREHEFLNECPIGSRREQ